MLLRDLYFQSSVFLVIASIVLQVYSTDVASLSSRLGCLQCVSAVQLQTQLHVIKKEPLIFDYNSRISRSIFIILAPVETRMNIPHYLIIYLLNCLMTS